MRGFLFVPLSILVLVASALVWARPVEADPSIGADGAFPFPGVLFNSVLEPAPGAPVFGPALPPPATVMGSLISPPAVPGFGEVDDFSYGDEGFTAAMIVEFSAGPNGAFPAVGHPASAPPPAPAFNLRQEAGVFAPPPFGDGAVNSDIYGTLMTGVLPCGLIGTNMQLLDGDGAAGPPYGPPRLALNMPEPASNIDAYERLDSTAVDTMLPIGFADLPVFFTIDPATAAGWPGALLPMLPAPGGGVAFPGPSDILAWNPAVGGPVIWATAAALGLVPGDDIDALAVSYISGAALPPGGPGWNVVPGGDLIIFSLAPGSPSLAPTSGGVAATPLAPVCGPPGTGTAGDLWFVAAPVAPGGATPLWDAEMLGLAAVRTAPVPVDDNLDALDFCNNLSGLDTDLDFVDDACDYDDDGDGIGDTIDPDADGDGFADIQSISHQGPANTDPTVDNCPGVPNPGQENTDGNFSDNSPPYVMAVDDKTMAASDFLGDACDDDNDNDGLSDATEALPAPCASATGMTSSLVQDTDGDRVHDGAECAMGSDPFSSASKPAIPPPASDPDTDRLSTAFETLIGTDPMLIDTDGDGLQDGWEYKGHGSDPLVIDGDGDGRRDGCEVASLNGDGIVNPGDQAMLASEIARVPPPAKLANFDLTKDGVLNAGDQAFQASRAAFGVCPP